MRAGPPEDPSAGSVEPGMARERFGRSLRLRESRDFRRIQRRGRRERTAHLVLLWLPSERELPRFGLAVSRKVGNAVTRNRVKRWLREAIRKNRGDLTYADVVLIARPGAGEADHRTLAAEVVTLLGAVRKRTSPGGSP